MNNCIIAIDIMIGVVATKSTVSAFLNNKTLLVVIAVNLICASLMKYSVKHLLAINII